MDETGLFFCIQPDGSIGIHQMEGSKKDKVRMTIALTVNAEVSEKLESVFIGKYLQPGAINSK